MMDRWRQTVRRQSGLAKAARAACAAVVALLALTMTAGCEQGEPGRPTEGASASSAPVSHASVATLPEITLDGIKALSAEAQAKGQFLVVDFWATWCLPCVEMFPTLHTELPKLGDHVRVVTVTLDTPGKYEALAVEFLRKHDALHDAYRIAAGNEALDAVVAGLGKQWQDMNVPAILVFGPDGQLVDEFINERAKLEVILPRMRELAAKPAGSAS